MEKTKLITAMQYAKYRYWTVQNVRKHFKFPEVLSVQHYSRFYLFVVPESMVIPD